MNIYISPIFIYMYKLLYPNHAYAKFIVSLFWFISFSKLMESNLCQNSGSGSIIFELIAKPFIHFRVNHITLCPTKGLNYYMMEGMT